MRIRLLRKETTPQSSYGIGTILNLTNSYAGRLIFEGKAEKYTGPYPPKKKMKMNLRDLKIKQNGNN